MSFDKKITTNGFVRIGLLLFALAANYAVSAQESADKIIAVVGRSRIILQSDLGIQFAQAKQQNPSITENDMCQLLQQMILQKMLMEQAERDSVLVGDEEVDAQLENRIRYFTSLYGSKEKLEQVSGKTIYQLKEEYRDVIKEQMVAEKLQGTILENSKITPAEVGAFYKKIPVDSLPFFPATVEVGQIVIDPPISEDMKDYAKDRLDKIRTSIVKDGRNFETEAAINSEDPGSRDNGGRIDGITRTGAWAPEFIAATFKLQPGEVSPVFKTKFGYHIVQMISRKGDEADVRHILIKPNVTTADFKKAMTTLDSIRNLLTSGKMTFQEAVGKFSTDEAAKRTGGMVTDMQTGTSELDMTKLDPGMVLLLDSMKQGDFSAPHIFINDARDKSCRIVYLRNRTSPHKANLKDDYGRIQEVAMSQKKQQKMQEWIKDRLPTFYLKIAPEYQTCAAIKAWGVSADAGK